MGITAIFSIATQALKAQQEAIQTTGHNVANAATPGYSRQRVILQTSVPAFEGGLLLGRGVNVTSVRSVIDRFSESQLLDVHRDLGFSTAQQTALSAIEEAFPTSGGIDTALGEFFAAFSELANNPSGAAERTSVISKANALGARFALTRQSLGSIQANLDQDLQAAVKNINGLTEQIAQLNQQIAFSESSGQPANDARDLRQSRVGELARLTGVTVNENSDGQLSILAQNVLLVSGNRAAILTTSPGSAGFHQVEVQCPDGIQFDATDLLRDGAIGGILAARDNILPDIFNELDTLAKAVVDRVNAQHAVGFDFSGTAGGDFFQPIAAVAGASALIHVASAVAADPKLIAAAASSAGAPGDNGNAAALANLRDTPIVALGNCTAEDYLLSTLGEIGENAHALQNDVDFQSGLHAQVQARREAVSGVNIDEEMTSLILFQRAFEASARLITTTDELYKSLIDMTR